MLESKLNELNIFALRDLARKTGVKTPTSKKKEQLIKEILEITAGLKAPENKTKQGRPPKVFDYNFAKVFDANVKNIQQEETRVLTSMQSLHQDAVEYEATEIVTVAGWLELVNNNAGILWVQKGFKNENYFVPNAVMQNLPVKMGDRIVAEVNLDETQKVVKKIFSINDCPVLKLPKKRNDYENLAHILPHRNLQFDDETLNSINIKIGENTYVYGANNNQNTQSVINLINHAKIENKFYVNVTVAGKNQIFLSALKNTESFLSNIMDESDIVNRLVTLAVERSKRALEIGEDVLLVVDDMASILGIEKVGLNLVKNLVSIAKETKGKGSITLVAIMPHGDFNQIEKLADKRLNIENNNFVEIN